METDKITSSYRVNIGEVQKNVEVSMQNDGENNISKILSSGATAYIDEIEMLNGEASYLGGVVFNLLYKNNNGENCVLSEKVDFSGKIQNDQINPLMKPIYEVEIINVKIVSADENSAKLSAVVSLKLDAIKTDEIQTLKVNDENVQIKKELASTNIIATTGTKTIEINEEFETKMDISKILLSNATVLIKDVDSGSGYFTISGDMFLNSLIEVNDDEEKSLKNFMQTINFKEELEDENVQKADNILAFANINPENLEVLVNRDEEGNTKSISVKAKIIVKYIAERKADCDICTDAFSLTNKTNMTTGTFMLADTERVEKFTATIEGQTVLNDDEARIAKVLAVTNEHLIVANQFVDNGKLTVEGVAYASIIYLTDDDVQQINSIDLEIPFANKFDIVDDFDGKLFVVGKIVDIDAKARKGKEVLVNMDVGFNVFEYNSKNQVIVKDIELTEKLPENEFAIEMFIAPKGSSLWDLSKRMLASQDEILAQNPNLVFPLEKQETIVHFNKKQKK